MENLIDKINIQAELLKKLKITQEEYLKIVELIGREPNEVELNMFSVMWSEHCAYKNSRPLLKQLPTKNEYVEVGPGENAGVIGIGDGIRIAFKIESHNRPTAIEPFQGATTGVGGILRDIFTMGARPIAVLDSLRFGDLNLPRSKYLFSGAVSGISHYGNCTGIPNIGGESYFYPTYNENPLVNAMAIGIIETDEIVKSGAKGFGNPVYYVGSKTGKDGIGGASFASSGLTEKSQEDRPAVQVGDPFSEKVLIEACLEAFKSGYVVAAQDMGAAGLTCSTSEMAAKEEVGIEIDLDKVPARAKNMTAREFMISESQERMLFVLEKGKETKVEEIFKKWDLDFVKIGEITDTKKVIVYHKGEIVVNLPAKALVDCAPTYIRESEEPKRIKENQNFDISQIKDIAPSEINTILKSLLSSQNICSKKWVYRKYDHEVQTNTVLKPGSTAGVIRIKKNNIPTKKGLAVSVDGNSLYVYLNPYLGAKIAVCEAARNVSCTGALPIAITNNLNFGNPEKKEIYYELKESVRGIKDACEFLNTPVTGGNVSLYNEGNGIDIWPTPVIGMVGYLDDVSLCIDHSFKKPGDLIVLLGKTKNEIGASEYLLKKLNKPCGPVPEINLDLEITVQATVRELIKQKLISSANDLSLGGLLVALSKSSFDNNFSYKIYDSFIKENSNIRLDALMFGESQSRIIISLEKENLIKIKEIIKKLNCPYQIIGEVTQTNAESMSLKKAWESSLSLFFN